MMYKSGHPVATLPATNHGTIRRTIRRMNAVSANHILRRIVSFFARRVATGWPHLRIVHL
eukprot:6207188-Pleurochrysis_carterae.AAC.4